jgi:diacylglycerol kinase (ATP)
LANAIPTSGQPAAPKLRSRRLILLNPRSFRMSLRGRLARIEAVTRRQNVPVRQVSGPEEIRSILQEALREGLDLLVIIGGDGTLQAAVSILAEIGDGRNCPEILVLGGGRTNYTARDIGTHSDLLNTLETALLDPGQLKHSCRHTLVVEQHGHEPVHGFFVAAGLVDFVIRDCHKYRKGGTSPLRQGHISSAWRVMQLAVLGLFRRVPYKPPRLGIEADSLGKLDGPINLLLMTSLHHRTEFVDPYAARGSGEVRLTAVNCGAAAFWRRLLRLVRGRYHRAMNPASGYLSGRTNRIRIRGLRQICLDGQELDFDPDHPLTVRTGPAFHFLHR